MSAITEQIAQLRREIDQLKNGNPFATVVSVNEGTGTVTVQLASDVTQHMEIPTHGSYIPEVGQQVMIFGGITPVAFAPVEPIVSAAPSAPDTVTVSPGVGDLVINWSPVDEINVKWNRGSYEVQVDSAPTFDSNNLQTIFTAATNKTVSSLVNGTSYFVRVRAVNYRGIAGAWSSIEVNAPSVVTLDRAINSAQLADGAANDPRVLDAYTVEEGANQFTDPAFAISPIAEWSSPDGSATVSRDLTVTRSPFQFSSMKIVATGTTGSPFLESTNMACIPGGTYVARAFLLSQSIRREVAINIGFLDASNNIVGLGDSNYITTDISSTLVWTAYNARGIAPPGTVSAVFALAIAGLDANALAGETHWMTGVEFRRTSEFVGEMQTASMGPRLDLGIIDGFPALRIWSQRDGETQGATISSEVDADLPAKDIEVPVLRFYGPNFAFLDDPVPVPVMELRSLDRLNPSASKTEIRTLSRIVRFRDPLYPSQGNLHAFMDESPMTARLAAATLRAGSDTNSSTTSNTLTDVDATNLKVTFTVPASGEVELRRCALIASSATGATYWGARDLSNVDVTAATQEVLDTLGAMNTARVRISDTVRVTGLTPGAQLTWKWTYRGTGGITVSFLTGPNLGAAEMSVWGIYS